MKRNYIGELRDQGLSYRKISEETGINSKKLSAYSTGKKALKSSSKEYEVIRNANRRIAYNKIRREGVTFSKKTGKVLPMSSREASMRRRTFTSPKTHYIQNPPRQVAHPKIQKNMYQLRLLAEYEHDKTHEVKLIESYSYAHASKPDTFNMGSDEFISDMGELNVAKYDDDQTMFFEAINEARSKCGSDFYSWNLKRILEIEVISYHIG